MNLVHQTFSVFEKLLRFSPQKSRENFDSKVKRPKGLARPLDLAETQPQQWNEHAGIQTQEPSSSSWRRKTFLSFDPVTSRDEKCK